MRDYFSFLIKNRGRGFMVHFHRNVLFGSVRKGAARFVFPPPKVGVTRTEPG